MSDACFRRWGRMLELGAHVGSKQRATYLAACDDALRAAVSEAEALTDPHDRVQRENAILHAMLRLAPAENVRSPLGANRSDSEREAAELFMLGLFESGPVARAIRASAGMAAPMAARLREIASEGRT